ncbi:MAG: hypothetical protein J3Q66DRAFT_335644 [Benniella sp.]|nr:MAG: hypothetical protein J3Q66DRAFT_335644 [Benniella sp.]
MAALEFSPLRALVLLSFSPRHEAEPTITSAQIEFLPHNVYKHLCWPQGMRRVIKGGRRVLDGGEATGCRWCPNTF